MPFEEGLSRSWYNKGQSVGRSGKHADMYAAWHSAKGKPTISGKRVTAQESFFQGYMDATQKNPASIRAQVRRLPSGQIQLKIPIGKSENPHSVIEQLKRVFGKRVKAVEMVQPKKARRARKTTSKRKH